MIGGSHNAELYASVRKEQMTSEEMNFSLQRYANQSENMLKIINKFL